MARTGRAILAAAVAVAALALGAATVAGERRPAPAAAPTVAHRLAESPSAVRSYWTPQRMLQARPLGGSLPSPVGPAPAGPQLGPPAFVPPASPGEAGRSLRGGHPRAAARAIDPGEERDFPNRVHGRVFFTTTAGDFACSGTAVSSPGRSLVLSAGHCVHDGEAWATNWVFVPGYRDGEAPYGRWPATRLRAPEAWVLAENISFDFSAATIAREPQGRALQDVVGARGIGFNQAREQLYTSYGYPAELPFDGESLLACRAPYGGDDELTDPPRTMRIECDMNGGSSGGGWVASGLVLSVNSYCTGFVLICTDGYLYGPYFGEVARQLYEQARGRAARCGGVQVSRLGSAADNSFAGGAGRDVIGLGAGDDAAAGRGGDDLLCGGRGGDLLRGGRGRDLCFGGPGRDSASGCEVTRRIP